MMKDVALVILVMLLYQENVFGCSRRRNPPPPPPPRNCEVNNWSVWSLCSHECGNDGEQTRTRTKSIIECCGGTCPFSLSATRTCNRDSCKNGGTPKSGSCSCSSSWTGTCCENDVNECLEKPCQHHCHNVPGSYTCSCRSCYSKSGTSCYLSKCKISGACPSFGTVNPSNQCQVCKRTNTFQWSNDDTLPCDDGHSCTRSDHCESGVCRGTPFTCRSCEQCDGTMCQIKPGFCVINGSCYQHKVVRSRKPCQQCDSNNPRKWTPNNNLQCSDGDVTTRNDRCTNGECRGEPYTCLPCQKHHDDACQLKPGYCIIKYNNVDTCYRENALKPDNPCQWCKPTENNAVWTDKNGVACDDGEQCTRLDTCQNGQCKGTSFTCNTTCQYCNGTNCRLYTGYGYIGGKCTCKIAGNDYFHQEINPSNKCQWCDLYDKTTKTSAIWSNRPAISCNDENACTKLDLCENGRCVGTPYVCRSSYPHSSCVRTSNCIIGDGTCEDSMKTNGTICVAAVDQCDQPERCDGVLGSCPAKVINAITLREGLATITSLNFLSSISFQSSTDTLYLNLNGFSASCGAIKMKYSILINATDNCKLTQSNRTLQLTNENHILSGLSLLNTGVYTIAVQAIDMRGSSGRTVCTNPVTIDASTPTGGWIQDGLGSKDLQYQASKAISASWGGFQTTHGVAKYLVAVSHKPQSTTEYSILQNLVNVNLQVSFTRTFPSLSDGSHVRSSIHAFTKAGLFTEISSDGVVVDSSPPSPGSVFDGAEFIDLHYANWATTYQASWTNFTDVHSPIINYKVGVQQKNAGLVSSALTSVGVIRTVTLTGLNLVSGFEYCALVEGANAAGLTSQATSNCVLIDHEVPHPGRVNDGQQSDIDYQSSDTELNANWYDFNDGPKGSGIREYKYRIEDRNGTQLTSWSSNGLLTHVNVPDLGLANGETYFVLVRAIDNAGLYMEVKSDGVYIDTSHPVYAGRIVIEGETGLESNDSVVYVKSNISIKANWPQFIDEHSGMMKYQWVVTETTVPPTQWQDVPGVTLATMATFTSLTLKDAKQYRLHIRGFNNAGLYAALSSTVFIPLSAAPTLGSVSDGGDPTTDIDYLTNTSEIRATWSGFDSSNLKSYYFAIGSCVTGNYHVTNNAFIPASPAHSTSCVISGLNLVNGQRYCVKIKAENLAGVQTVPVSSDGFTVDITSPDVKRAMVLDGSGDDDIDFQSSTTELCATWLNMVDQESDIHHFQVAVSRQRVGPPDVTSFSNVGQKTSARITNLTLTNDVYYVIVCATNYAGLESCVTSDGVLIDPTVATKGVVHDGIIEPDIQYQSSTTTICANWEGIYDLESRLDTFKWGIWESSDQQAGVHLDSVDAGLQTHMCYTNATLNLKHGHNYTVFVHVYNRAGGMQTLRSNGVVIDTTAPIPSKILPTGPHWTFVPHSNAYYAPNLFAAINVYWDDFEEQESELWYYKWSLGTSRFGTQIQPFINIGLSTNANTTTNDVTLRQGVPYYVTVMARNRAGLVSGACSPPMILDNSAPILGTIRVVSDEGLSKTHYSASEEISVQWEGFKDYESGVQSYKVTLGCDDGTLINYIMKSTDILFRIPSKQLLPAQIYRITVTCINNLGLSTSINSEPFVIDNTAPVYVGNNLPRRHFVSNLQQLAFSWEPFMDNESPVVSYEIGIGTAGLRDDIQEFKDIGLATDFELSRDVPAEHNTHYYVTVKANNAANLSTLLLTDVLHSDQTPATGQNNSVMDGLSGEDIDFISTHDKISAHWENIEDLESGVINYEYCIGTTPSNCRVKGFTDVANNTSFVCNACQPYPGGTFYVQLRVTNAAGLSTSFTSNGVTVDASPPFIGKVFDGETTQAPDVEKAGISWTPTVTWYGAHDPESGVGSCEWRIVEHHENNDVTIYHKQLDTLSYNVPQTIQADTKLNLTYNTLYHNVIQCWNKAGIFKKRYSNGWSVIDEWPVTSHVRDGTGAEDLDYDVTGRTVGASWGPFRGDANDPVVGYEWSLGIQPGVDDIMGFKEVGLITRTVVTLSDTDISLEPGTRYYVTVRATALSGRTSERSSDGFIVDTTPPSGGRVSLKYVMMENRKVDLVLDWQGFKDDESGIDSYDYCLGTIKNVCFFQKITAKMSTRATVNDFPAAATGLPIYGIVIATNGGGLRTIRSSAPLQIDMTAPVVGSVINGHDEDWEYITSSVALVTTWFGFYDAETGIDRCTLTVLQESVLEESSLKPMAILKMEVDANGSEIHSNLTLSSGTRCRSLIECSNPSGLMAATSSNGVIIDDTPPVVPTIVDGSHQVSDIQHQVSTDTLAAHWFPAKDPESGIKEYLVAVETGSNEDLQFYSVGLANEMKLTNLTLTPGSSYYIQLEIINNAGLRSRVATNGVTVDTSAPVVSELKLQSETFVGGEYVIGATWSSEDEESDIMSTEYCVGTTLGGCQLREMSTLQNTATNVTCFDCELTHKNTYYLSVRVWNNAGLFSLATTSAVQADVTAPVTGDVAVSTPYMSCINSCTLHATLSGFRDEESGIRNCEFTVNSSNGSIIRPVESTASYSNLIDVTELRLAHGESYQLAVRCINFVGEKSVEIYSSPVLIDNTPPNEGRVIISAGRNEDIRGEHNGCHLMKSALRIHWFGFYNEQSDMAAFRVGVGRAPFTVGVIPYQTLPRIVSSTQFMIDGRYGLSHGDTIFATVEAVNKAGLTTIVSSLPTRVISDTDKNLVNERGFECVNV